jgi:hypothetical protein
MQVSACAGMTTGEEIMGSREMVATTLPEISRIRSDP